MPPEPTLPTMMAGEIDDHDTEIFPTALPPELRDCWSLLPQTSAVVADADVDAGVVGAAVAKSF